MTELLDEYVPFVTGSEINDDPYNPISKFARTMVATKGDDRVRRTADHVIEIPVSSELLSPILEIVPLQLLAYHIAVRRGCDVDQPRNLAKSVTVE